MIAALAALWCKLAHGEPMHPIHSRYICPTCLRVTPVDWTISPWATNRPVEGAAVRAAAPTLDVAR